MHIRRQFPVADDAIERFVLSEMLYLCLHSRSVGVAAVAGNSLLAVNWILIRIWQYAHSKCAFATHSSMAHRIQVSSAFMLLQHFLHLLLHIAQVDQCFRQFVR